MFIGHNEDCEGIDISVVEGTVMWGIVAASLLGDLFVTMVHVAIREDLFNPII